MLIRIETMMRTGWSEFRTTIFRGIGPLELASTSCSSW